VTGKDVDDNDDVGGGDNSNDQRDADDDDVDDDDDENFFVAPKFASIASSTIITPQSRKTDTKLVTL
jgi:hypothetical protein